MEDESVEVELVDDVGDAVDGVVDPELDSC